MPDFSEAAIPLLGRFAQRDVQSQVGIPETYGGRYMCS